MDRCRGRSESLQHKYIGLSTRILRVSLLVDDIGDVGHKAVSKAPRKESIDIALMRENAVPLYLTWVHSYGAVEIEAILTFWPSDTMDSWTASKRIQGSGQIPSFYLSLISYQRLPMIERRNSMDQVVIISHSPKIRVHQNLENQRHARCFIRLGPREPRIDATLLPARSLS